MRRSTAIVLFGLGLASAAQAQDPDPRAVQPERPTVATHAYTVATGWGEVEAGVEFDRFSAASHGGTAPVVVKIGVGRRAQFDLVANAVAPAGGSLGVGDAGIALKWRAVIGSPVLGDFSLQPSLKFPTGSLAAGRGTGTTDVGVILISSRQVGPVALDLNFGYVRRSGDGSGAPRDATMWAVSMGGTLHRRLGWVGEFFGYPATTGPAGAPSTAALLAGPTVLVHPWFSLDAGLIIPLTGPQPRALYLGTVYNLGRIW